MNCTEAIEYIHSLEKFGINPGLERINALCSALGNPQRELKIIHVAGTNGKGSTSTMISNILQMSGYKTGLFISPYVSDFRERIQLNGNMIEENELAYCVERVKTAIDNLASENIQPTEFEAITAAAFLYFKEKKCDFAVVEVGLGGRLDSTNIVDTPCVCVITSISLDHTAILGDTIDKIAAEKCGIIKHGGVTVCYPFQKAEALEVIEKTCRERSNELIIPDLSCLKIGTESIDGTQVSYNGTDFLLPLAGRHMVYNACTAIEAVKALNFNGINISDEAIKKGIECSSMPARLELIKKNPVILLDGGHNEGCALALADFIKKRLGGKKILMLCSMMSDKDYMAYLRIAAPLADGFISTQASVPRALNSGELREKSELFCKDCSEIQDPASAAKAALERLAGYDALVVCGSFYLASEIRGILYDF
ncbi:MAG: bifunctional folylpolyglutamate synthase/dihydrofolate synthase [Acutalibacteraceae bacterium]